MAGKLASMIAMVAVLSLVSRAQPETEPAGPAPEPSPAPMEEGPDPTVVESGHYTAEFENDRVRILRVAYGPGEESVLHYHPDLAAVFLTDHLVEMTLPDGSTEELPASAGDTVFAPAGHHQSKNIADGPMELILVELKPDGPSSAEPDGPDPTVVDPEHYTTDFENDQVRILRIAYGPGEEGVMHYHPDSAAVFLTDLHVEMSLPDGSTEELSAQAGDAIFTPAGQHRGRNLGDAPFEVIQIELK